MLTPKIFLEEQISMCEIQVLVNIPLKNLLDPSNLDLKDETRLNPRLQRNKNKENKRGKDNFFGFFVVEEKDRPVPRKGLWGHYTSLGEA
jgi:hypothetical protein